MTFRSTALLLALSLTTAYGGGRLSSQARSYHVVHGWPALPTNSMLNEVSAVAVDSRENVFVLTRGGRKWPDEGPLDTTAIPKSTVIVFDARSGRLLSKWPNNILALPHSITIDDHDNVWITDVAWHQVFKFTRDGKLLMTLGQRGVAGDDATHFNRPSDVAVSRDGVFYVSDGYGNNRIMKFGADGALMKTWGTKGASSGQLDLPHGLAVSDAGKVYVVDRSNARIQIFNSEGAYVTQWRDSALASAQAIKVAKDGHVFVANAGEAGPVDRTGVVVLDSTGHIIEKVGRFGNYDGQFLDLHWVALSRAGALYTADFEGRRVQRFIR